MIPLTREQYAKELSRPSKDVMRLAQLDQALSGKSASSGFLSVHALNACGIPQATKLAKLSSLSNRDTTRATVLMARMAKECGGVVSRLHKEAGGMSPVAMCLDIPGTDSTVMYHIPTRKWLVSK